MERPSEARDRASQGPSEQRTAGGHRPLPFRVLRLLGGILLLVLAALWLHVPRLWRGVRRFMDRGPRHRLLVLGGAGLVLVALVWAGTGALAQDGAVPDATPQSAAPGDEVVVPEAEPQSEESGAEAAPPPAEIDDTDEDAREGTPLPTPPVPVAAEIYHAQPGEKWVDVNLTTAHITAFEGDRPVRGPVPMVPGAPGWDTVEGVFHVYLKNAVQDLGCTGGYPWCERNVPWVTYFQGDYAFHAAPWRKTFGWRGEGGSHGCVNLPVDEAKWIFDWADFGTTVVSHR